MREPKWRRTSSSAALTASSEPRPSDHGAADEAARACDQDDRLCCFHFRPDHGVHELPALLESNTVGAGLVRPPGNDLRRLARALVA